MPGLCFFFENRDVDVWSGREIDLDAWNYAAKAAGDIDQIIVINKTDVKLNWLYEIEEVSELPKLKGKIAYVCCPWDLTESSVSLWEFDHDVDWYVFGPASGWSSLNIIPEFAVNIPVANNIALHSVHIASTVMLHRYQVIES